MREIRKNANEVIRVEPHQFKGYDFANIRVFCKTDEDKWVPTRKGITIRIEMLPDLIDAMKELLSEGAPSGA